MKELLQHLIESLREELKEYGEMLALLDLQQELVVHRRPQDLLECVTAINSQAETIATAREEREQRRRHAAVQLNLHEDSSFNVLIPHFPPEYRPLIHALVQENNELLIRVQQRARQNHLLLNRVVELMQRFLSTLFPGAAPTTYNGTGHTLSAVLPQRPLYDAIG
ncbi:MAG TPA: flagellar export chaperone FlgN [Verrucomicrobiae bacterium]|nr:flagellar export chaperone FlgN [Verrucomicrobiae bacterium]